MTTSECVECFAYLKDRGILGGLRWYQCQGCGAWVHRKPTEEEINRDWVPDDQAREHAQTRLDKMNRDNEVSDD